MQRPPRPTSFRHAIRQKLIVWAPPVLITPLKGAVWGFSVCVCASSFFSDKCTRDACGYTISVCKKMYIMRLDRETSNIQCHVVLHVCPGVSVQKQPLTHRTGRGCCRPVPQQKRKVVAFMQIGIRWRFFRGRKPQRGFVIGVRRRMGEVRRGYGEKTGTKFPSLCPDPSCCIFSLLALFSFPILFIPLFLTSMSRLWMWLRLVAR